MTEATTPLTTAPVIPFPKKTSGKRAEDTRRHRRVEITLHSLPRSYG